MIVYNVERRWFTMKSDADIHRRNLKLPPGALYTLRIDDRDDLAGLLNALCGLEAPVAPLMVDLPVEVVKRNQIEVPDCVPKFLVDDWNRRNGN